MTYYYNPETGLDRSKARDWFVGKLEFVNSVLNEQDNPTENLF